MPAEPAWTARPDDVAAASVFAEVRRLIAPPAVSTRPFGRIACAVVFAMLIEIAAATATESLESSEVDAFGVELEPAPEPPLPADFELAKFS
jgi:hypothetical protein